MADLSDVETAIVSLIASLVYPNGSSNPSAVLNDSGQPMPVRVYRGWPISQALDIDLARGVMNISVFNRPGTERNVTKFHPDYQQFSIETPTVAATVNASNQVVITGAGSPTIVQYVTVLVGSRVITSYSVLPSDTPTSIATAIATALTTAGAPCTSSGGTITLTGSAKPMFADVGITGVQEAEFRRQITQMQISCWCPSPTSRDNVAKLVEPTLAMTTFLTTPDGFATRFRYHNTVVFDSAEKVDLYRRDLIYDAEYPTTVSDTVWEITSVDTNVQPPFAPRNDFITEGAGIPAPQNLYPGPPYVPIVPSAPANNPAPGPTGPPA